MKKILIVTSSSYNNMLEKGGYGCIVIDEDNKLLLSDGYCKSTGNRMELKALVRALEELEKLYPNESLKIELASKLTYLTISFSPNKLRSNIQAGESLVNYDIWKQIFDLGCKHSWKVLPIKTIALERLHRQAAKLAGNSIDNIEDSKVDEGVHFSSPKIAKQSKPIFELPNESAPEGNVF